MTLSPFKRDWRGPANAARRTVGGVACRGGGRGGGGGAGLITHSLLHSFLGPPAPSRRNRPRGAGSCPGSRDQSVHIQLWTQDPGPLPHRQAPPGQAARSLALRPHRPRGTGQEEALLQVTRTLTAGWGGRGKDEGLSSARLGGGWAWALSGCSSSGGGADVAPSRLGSPKATSGAAGSGSRHSVSTAGRTLDPGGSVVCVGICP